MRKNIKKWLKINWTWIVLFFALVGSVIELHWYYVLNVILLFCVLYRLNQIEKKLKNKNEVKKVVKK